MLGNLGSNGTVSNLKGSAGGASAGASSTIRVGSGGNTFDGSMEEQHSFVVALSQSTGFQLEGFASLLHFCSHSRLKGSKSLISQA
jgi:hypothetical protein